MRNKVGVNTCVHLGPGTFQTAGFYEGIGTTTGWQVKPGLRLVGSGVDVTILKRVNDVPANKIGYAVGHELTKTGPSPNLVDFAEITELSIDANFAELTNAGTAASAIRMMGNHARAVRVKITNWGNKSSTIPSFGIALLTGNTNSGIVASDVVAVTNCGIDSCIALTPSPTSSGTVVALQVGAKEDPGTVEALGVAPYLRSSFVDCGSPLTLNLVGLGMSWCVGGIVEGNTVLNAYFGGPSSSSPNSKLRGARSLIIRGNVYRNVFYPIFRGLDTELKQDIEINQNTFELGVGMTSSAVYVSYSTTGPVTGRTSAVGNSIRNIDGTPVADAIHVQRATNLGVKENIIHLVPPAGPSPIWFKLGTTAAFFENRTSSGVLIQGRDDVTGALMTELATDADDALILSFLRKR